MKSLIKKLLASINLFFIFFCVIEVSYAEVCQPVMIPPVEGVIYLNKIAFSLTQSVPICRLNDSPDFLMKVNEKWGKDKCPFDISEGNHLIISNSEYIKRRIKLNTEYSLVTDGNAEVVIFKNKIQVVNGKVEVFSNSTGSKIPIESVGRSKECKGSFISEPPAAGNP